ncbi:D-amino acid oxidase 2 isoform X2 [Oratosquilla oratoria]|uniref:D-amino acid oxidase 2 isoform X2 n=1 Tax=Oratosquilla oratoria TaxID=337810 RepID=UPI003F7706C3
MSAPEVVVVGCGVVGLGAALNVQQKVHGSRVRIVTEATTPHTTADGAAGLWGPYIIEDTPVNKIIKWSSSTWDLFHGWMKSGANTSVMLIPGVTISNQELQPEPWRHIPFAYRHLDQPTIRKRFGDDYVSAYEYTSLVAEPLRFMPKLLEEFKSNGGIIEHRKVTCLEEEAKSADILVNCSGLGARELALDSQMYPVRGQVMRVHAPWVDSFFCDESDENFCYIIPNVETVVLGGTHQEDDSRLNVDLDDKRIIWSRCTTSMPSLQVVHNYGHGGAGVSLFWGCGQEVAELVGQALHRIHGPPHKPQCYKHSKL